MRLMNWEESIQVVYSLERSLDQIFLGNTPEDKSQEVVPGISMSINRDYFTNLLRNHHTSHTPHAFPSFSEKPYDHGQEFDYRDNRFTFSITRLINPKLLFGHKLSFLDRFSHGWGRYSSSRLIYEMMTHDDLLDTIGSNMDKSHNIALGKLKTYSHLDEYGRRLSVSIPVIGIPGVDVEEMGIISDWMRERTEAHVKRKGIRGHLGHLEKLTGDSKKMEINWTGTKKLTDYFKLEANISFKVSGLTKVEINQNGAKVQTNKGRVEVSIQGILIRDYQGKFEKSAFQKFLRGIYEKWVIPSRIEEYEGKIILSLDEFLSQTKAFLDLEGKR